MAELSALSLLKTEIKAWERSFTAEHGRKPVVADISAKPDIQRKYRAYRALKEPAPDLPVSRPHGQNEPEPEPEEPSAPLGLGLLSLRNPSISAANGRSSTTVVEGLPAATRISPAAGAATTHEVPSGGLQSGAVESRGAAGALDRALKTGELTGHTKIPAARAGGSEQRAAQGSLGNVMQRRALDALRSSVAGRRRWSKPLTAPVAQPRAKVTAETSNAAASAQAAFFAASTRDRAHSAAQPTSPTAAASAPAQAPRRAYEQGKRVLSEVSAPIGVQTQPQSVDCSRVSYGKATEHQSGPGALRSEGGDSQGCDSDGDMFGASERPTIRKRARMMSAGSLLSASGSSWCCGNGEDIVPFDRNALVLPEEDAESASSRAMTVESKRLESSATRDTMSMLAEKEAQAACYREVKDHPLDKIARSMAKRKADEAAGKVVTSKPVVRNNFVKLNMKRKIYKGRGSRAGGTRPMGWVKGGKGKFARRCCFTCGKPGHWSDKCPQNEGLEPKGDNDALDDIVAQLSADRDVSLGAGPEPGGTAVPPAKRARAGPAAARSGEPEMEEEEDDEEVEEIEEEEMEEDEEMEEEEEMKEGKEMEEEEKGQELGVDDVGDEGDKEEVMEEAMDLPVAPVRGEMRASKSSGKAAVSASRSHNKRVHATEKNGKAPATGPRRSSRAAAASASSSFKHDDDDDDDEEEEEEEGSSARVQADQSAGDFEDECESSHADGNQGYVSDTPSEIARARRKDLLEKQASSGKEVSRPSALRIGTGARGKRAAATKRGSLLGKKRSKQLAATLQAVSAPSEPRHKLLGELVQEEGPDSWGTGVGGGAEDITDAKEDHEASARMQNVSSEEMQESLRGVFGHHDFRAGQEQALQRILRGESTLFISATGGGKSLCFQLPACHLSGTTLVISPLLSLIDDQLSNMPPRIVGATLNSTQTPEEQAQVVEGLKEGKIQVLFVAPERLLTDQFLALARQLPPFNLACIDEAHCVSEWAHTFRPSYLRLNSILRNQLRVSAILALTATATVAMEKDICLSLGIPAAGVVRVNLMRPNLRITVSADPDRQNALLDMLSKDPHFKEGSTIVYCSLRAQCDSIAQFLQQRTLSAERYHAGRSTAERTRVQRNFMTGKTRIVVATVAFGMGIDKSDVRSVVHFNCPNSMEAYVQEIGRAGRDGATAHCHVFSDPADFARLQTLARADGVDLPNVAAVITRVLTPPKGVATDAGWLVAVAEDEDSRYDISKESLGTVLTFLEQEGLVQVCNPSYSEGAVGLLHPEKLDDMVQGSPVMSAVVRLGNLKNGQYKFCPCQVATAVRCSAAKVIAELRNLSRARLLRVDWTGKAYVVKVPRAVDAAEFAAASARVQARLGALEERKVSRVEALKNLLQKNPAGSWLKAMEQWRVFSAAEAPRPEADGEETTAGGAAAPEVVGSGEAAVADRPDVAIHQAINAYFTEALPTTQVTAGDAPTAPAAEEGGGPARRTGAGSDRFLRGDIISFVHSVIGGDTRSKRDNLLTGRAVARILHGLHSPAFPIKIWGRNRLWGRYDAIPFERIREISDDVIAASY